MATGLKLNYNMHHRLTVLPSETNRRSTFSCHPFIIHSPLAKTTVPLCSSKQQAMKTYEGGGMAPCSLKLST